MSVHRPCTAVTPSLTAYTVPVVHGAHRYTGYRR
jgi:hypothetical protein